MWPLNGWRRTGMSGVAGSGDRKGHGDIIATDVAKPTVSRCYGSAICSGTMIEKFRWRLPKRSETMGRSICLLPMVALADVFMASKTAKAPSDLAARIQARFLSGRWRDSAPYFHSDARAYMLLQRG
jgi:hypothetical protein